MGLEWDEPAVSAHWGSVNHGKEEALRPAWGDWAQLWAVELIGWFLQEDHRTLFLLVVLLPDAFAAEKGQGV